MAQPPPYAGAYRAGRITSFAIGSRCETVGRALMTDGELCLAPFRRRGHETTARVEVVVGHLEQTRGLKGSTWAGIGGAKGCARLGGIMKRQVLCSTLFLIKGIT